MEELEVARASLAASGELFPPGSAAACRASPRSTLAIKNEPQILNAELDLGQLTPAASLEEQAQVPVLAQRYCNQTEHDGQQQAGCAGPGSGQQCHRPQLHRGWDTKNGVRSTGPWRF
jgi:hypothetical protein